MCTCTSRADYMPLQNTVLEPLLTDTPYNEQPLYDEHYICSKYIQLYIELSIKRALFIIKI